MSGTRCTVCDHPDLKAIDAAVAVSSERSIARQWSLSPAAVHRHKAKHLRPAAARLASRREEMGAQALLEKLTGCIDVLEESLGDARKEGDHVAVARLIKELRETIVRLGQATRGLWSTTPQTIIDNRRQTVNIANLTTDELRNLARLVPASDAGA